MEFFLADAASDVANNPFATFGALGILAGIGVWLIRRESARADRLENKNDKLNEGIRDTVIPALTQHAQAIDRALEVLKDIRRGDANG